MGARGWQGPWAEADGGCSMQRWGSGGCCKGGTEGSRDHQAAAKPGDESIIPASPPGQQVSPVVPVLQSHKMKSHRNRRQILCLKSHSHSLAGPGLDPWSFLSQSLSPNSINTLLLQQYCEVLQGSDACGYLSQTAALWVFRGCKIRDT